MISQKQERKKLNMDDLKDVIRSADLSELRMLDISIKERKAEIIKKDKNAFKPSESLSVSNIHGIDYLYLHKKVKGKTVSRIVKEDEFSEFNFDAVKISDKARKHLQEKYKLDL